MDFLTKLKAHMEGLPNTPSVIEIGSYNDDGDSVAIRPAPSNTEFRDMAQGKIYPFSFQILVHHKNNFTAYLTLQDLVEAYDMTKVVIPGTGYTLLSIRCTTNPNYVETTQYGTLWTALFEAELYITK